MPRRVLCSLLIVLAYVSCLSAQTASGNNAGIQDTLDVIENVLNAGVIARRCLCGETTYVRKNNQQRTQDSARHGAECSTQLIACACHMPHLSYNRYTAMCRNIKTLFNF